jgi:hypothetical protein
MSAKKRNMFSLLADDESDNDNNENNDDNKYNEVAQVKIEEKKEEREEREEKKEKKEEKQVIDKIEEENSISADFEQVEKEKKVRRNRFDTNNNSNIDSQHVFRDEKLLENKIVYDENKNYGEIGNDKKLNSYWTVWVHKTNCNDWTLSGYQKIYVINSIGSFWRFFNNFQLLNSYQNQIFIMREEIAPIWEDVNNKFGGICSIKIDSIQKGMKTDLSTEVLTLVSLLIMNETFTAQNKNINGISYSVKKRSSLIKIWTKTFSEEHNFVKDLPVPLMNKFNTEMQKQNKNIQNSDGKISIQYKQIKPEFEL